MSDIETLHDATAYNAAAGVLNGNTLIGRNDHYALVWFAATGSYDGTANFEISPDGGATWYATEGEAFGAFGTLLSTVASPAAATLYRFPLPSESEFRVRMSGGSQGALSVFARRAYMWG